MFNPRLQANYLAKTQDIAGKVGKRVSDTLDGIDATRVESFAGLQLNEVPPVPRDALQDRAAFAEAGPRSSTSRRTPRQDVRVRRLHGDEQLQE